MKTTHILAVVAACAVFASFGDADELKTFREVAESGNKMVQFALGLRYATGNDT